MSYLFAFSYCSCGSQGKNTEVVCHSLLQWTTFCQSSPPWPVRLGWPHTAWLSFIELDKAVVHVSDWLVVCDCGFSLSDLWCPLSAPTVLLGFLLPWAWGISSWLLQQSTAAPPCLGRGVTPLSHCLWPLSSVAALSSLLLKNTFKMLFIILIFFLLFLWLHREACRIITAGAPGSSLMLTSAQGILEKLCVQKNWESPPLDMQDGNFVHQLASPITRGTLRGFYSHSPSTCLCAKESLQQKRNAHTWAYFFLSRSFSPVLPEEMVSWICCTVVTVTAEAAEGATQGFLLLEVENGVS